MKTIILFFLGASIGSFLGLVIDRFPEQSIIAPSSHCNSCKRRLKAWDLIPILSQLSTKSKCRYCKAKIPYWYLGLEFLAGLLVLLCNFHILSIAETILIFAGLVLTIYDIKHRISLRCLARFYFYSSGTLPAQLALLWLFTLGLSN